MRKLSAIGMSAGALLLLSLAASPPVLADMPGATMDANGVVTANPPAYGAPPTGYYDQRGGFHYGWKPYLTGYYDGHGDWHDYPNMEVIPGSGPPVKPTFPDEWRYEYSRQNFYAGYGSRMVLQSGWTRIVGCDDQPHWVDLRANRVYVHLIPGDPWNYPLVNQFDPTVVEISTGQTVTFVTDAKSYALSPEYESCPQFDQKVVINPDRVFSWTYTQPGIYKIKNAFGGGPSDCHYGGLIIKVSGDAVPFDDSAFVCCTSYGMKRLPYSYTPSVWNPTVLQTETHYTPPQPPPPHKVKKKKVLRNQDVK